jgi:alkylation response protein AidB-like acyl-CoA dehydrogenase
MDFDLTDEQRMFRDEVIRFARAELNEDVVARDARSSFAAEAWRKCAGLGLLGLRVPTRSRSWSRWRRSDTGAGTTA